MAVDILLVAPRVPAALAVVLRVSPGPVWRQQLGCGASESTGKVKLSRRLFEKHWAAIRLIRCPTETNWCFGAGNTLLPLLVDDPGQPDTVLSLKLVT